MELKPKLKLELELGLNLKLKLKLELKLGLQLEPELELELALELALELELERKKNAVRGVYNSSAASVVPTTASCRCVKVRRAACVITVRADVGNANLPFFPRQLASSCFTATPEMWQLEGHLAPERRPRRHLLALCACQCIAATTKTPNTTSSYGMCRAYNLQQTLLRSKQARQWAPPTRRPRVTSWPSCWSLRQDARLWYMYVLRYSVPCTRVALTMCLA